MDTQPADEIDVDGRDDDLHHHEPGGRPCQPKQTPPDGRGQKRMRQGGTPEHGACTGDAVPPPALRREIETGPTADRVASADSSRSILRTGGEPTERRQVWQISSLHGFPPLSAASSSTRRSLPQNIRSPRKKVGTPNAPRALASSRRLSCRTRVSAACSSCWKGFPSRPNRPPTPAIVPSAIATPSTKINCCSRRQQRTSAPCASAARQTSASMAGSVLNATGSRNGMP